MFKRILLASAIASAFAVPAMAEVSISGSAEMDFFYRTNNTVDGDGKFLQEIAIVINVDGKDKLDNGNTLSWRLAQKVATPDRFDAWGIREAWIGYSGDWGSLKFGNQFSNTYLIQDWPYGSKGFSGTMGEVANVGFGQGISYTSPTFAGMNVSAAYDFGDNVGQDVYAWETTLQGAWGNFNLDAGYYRSENGKPVPAGRDWSGATASSTRPNGLTEANGDSYANWIVGGRAQFGDFGLRAAVRGMEDTTAGVDTTAIGYLVGGTYSMGKHALSLGYMYQEAEKDGISHANNDFQTIGFQWDYALSKNTGAFLQVRHNMVGEGWNTNTAGTSIWQNADGMAGGQDNATRILIGTWTGF
ncbi:porin [Chitinilyticum piscinae]|uniref:Porin n=1 Tax=Chitinilyticum piscinae TaxID=2866724 RepID=A0A8J7FQ97_9NEIS|nr:porin [Chitinilyticum piscinae]MBE9608691.1 porin [Chitinilyticum piscinae]